MYHTHVLYMSSLLEIYLLYYYYEVFIIIIIIIIICFSSFGIFQSLFAVVLVTNTKMSFSNTFTQLLEYSEVSLSLFLQPTQVHKSELVEHIYTSFGIFRSLFVVVLATNTSTQE